MAQTDPKPIPNRRLTEPEPIEYRYNNRFQTRPKPNPIPNLSTFTRPLSNLNPAPRQQCACDHNLHTPLAGPALSPTPLAGPALSPTPIAMPALSPTPSRRACASYPQNILTKSPLPPLLTLVHSPATCGEFWNKIFLAGARCGASGAWTSPTDHAGKASTR